MSTPLSSSDPADLPNLARCFSACVPPGEQTALRNYLTANIAALATNPVCTAPSAPTGVSASNARVADPNTQMNVRWLQPANSGSFITGYVIKWGTVSGVYTNSMNVPLTPHNFTVTGLTPGTTYFFVVQAFAFAGCVSANSNEASNSTSGSGVCNSGTTFATAWAARVVANGGANPSAATQTAIANFQCGLITDGLDTLMLSWNAIVPDNLIASITPQLVGGGNDPWTNHGPFVGGDLTVNGLTGDGVGKYLDAGLIQTGGTGATNGLVLYDYLVGGAASGALNGGILNLYGNFGGNSVGGSGGNPTNVISVASSGNGFYSNQRVTNSDHRLFFANSLNPHAQIGATDVNAFLNPIPSNPIFIFCLDLTGAPNSFATDTISFYGSTKGLTSAQSASLFARVQTLRTALGGGFR